LAIAIPRTLFLLLSYSTWVFQLENQLPENLIPGIVHSLCCSRDVGLIGAFNQSHAPASCVHND
jgi:hypothetical protein